MSPFNPDHPLSMIPDVIAFAGDWHADTAWALCAVNEAVRREADVLIHAGDFGWKFEPDFLDPLTAELERLNLPLFFVDGNHEDFDWLLARPVDKKSRLRQVTKMIWHIPRATRWDWDGLKFMGLGGAVSVDRMNRVQHASWWPQEEVTTVDGRRARRAGKVDVMIMHDCPAGVKIPGLLDVVPESWRPMMPAAIAHREKLRRIVNSVQPNLVVHGHYHQSYRKRVQSKFAPNSSRVVHDYYVMGLAHNGTSMADNLAVYTLDDLKERFGA